MAQAAPVRKEADLSGPFGLLLESRQRVFRNSSGDIPACLRMARKVPSRISPGWLGIVVYRSVSAWNQISCDPAACRSKAKPSVLRRLAICRQEMPASLPFFAATR